ncbi:hypothetical protein [Cellulomonas oligotrophica]|uniref:Lipoprotein n=1 Tax=Cellulomonas oligotrophica TaxID=931536 RepID=A0A7Y9FGC0_9CELL|nr:hypothetical protein [Cellulomonas oligotrophica]NYD86816.1 hypothetical protein [Cellulomonas oligotrophica]GIG32399.1 hypothetical protein Col01nite_15580 [Cellulomonas oligotrophica]
MSVRGARRAAGVVLALLLVAAGPGAASAAPTQVCEQGVTPVSPAPGDVVVAQGCVAPGLVVRGDVHVLTGVEDVTLAGLRVDGDVHVAPSVSWLQVEDARVGGDVVLARSGLVVLRQVEVAGDVRMDGPGTVAVEDSTVRGDVHGQIASFGVWRSRLFGGVDLVATDGEDTATAHLRGTWVGGWVQLRHGRPSFVASTFAGGVRLVDVRGGEVCASSVGTDVELVGVRGEPEALRLGGRALNGSCAGGPTVNPVRVAGTVRVLDGTGPPVVLDALRVGYHLGCTGNAAPPTLGDVVVLGTRSGQCA